MPSARQAFAEAFEPSKARIRNFPAKLFLCGGKISRNFGEAESFRHFFFHHIKSHHPPIANSFVLAENLNEWFDGDLFPDLLALEHLIAHLSALVVLFVESAGSIAELGAFCLLEPIKEKLMVIVERTHSNERSFITLGPVRAIKRHREQFSLSVPWYLSEGRELDPSRIEQVLPDVVDAIVSALKAQPTQTVFQSRNPGHIMLLLADIVGLFRIARLLDLKKTLAWMGFSLKEKTIKQYLYLLEKLNFVRKERYINTDYYIPAPNNRGYILYGFKPDVSNKDILRWKALIHGEQEQKEPEMLRALKVLYRPSAADLAS